MIKVEKPEAVCAVKSENVRLHKAKGSGFWDEVFDWPQRLWAVELSAVGGGEETVDVLKNQVLHVTEHVAQVPANTQSIWTFSKLNEVT